MEKIIAYTNGISKGNPGPAAAGVYVVDESGEVVTEVSQSLGNSTDDFAQYHAVMLALQSLVQLFDIKTKDMQFEIKLDSEFVKQQLNGEIQIKHPGLVPMFIEIHNMRVVDFPNLTFTKVSAKKNKEAFRLVSEVLSGK